MAESACGISKSKIPAKKNFMLKNSGREKF